MCVLSVSSIYSANDIHCITVLVHILLYVEKVDYQLESQVNKCKL